MVYTSALQAIKDEKKINGVKAAIWKVAAAAAVSV